MNTTLAVRISTPSRLRLLVDRSRHPITQANDTIGSFRRVHDLRFRSLLSRVCTSGTPLRRDPVRPEERAIDGPS
jgi:hypothetical protein